MIEHENELEIGLSDLINAFSTAVFVLDRRHRCVMLNDECCQVWECSREAILGKTAFDYLPKEQAQRIWDYDEGVFLGGVERREEMPMTNQRGVRRIYTVTKTPFKDRAGRLWLIGGMTDVTGHREVLDEYRFMASLLEAQNEATIAGILVVDDRGRILTANRQFREMWGISDHILATGLDETVRRSVLSRLADPEGFERRVDELYRHPLEEGRDHIELKDGRTFDRYSSPVIGKDGVYYGRVWQFRDITEIRTCAALTAEIQHRRELDSLKDAFIGTVSHELRTPLTIVRTAVDSLRTGLAGPLSEQQQELVDVCQRNALRLTKMINNLLDISRLESGKAKVRLERFDLRPLIRDMESSFRLLPRGKEISFQVEAPAGLPEVRADPDLISEVFYNLLDNAARYAESEVSVRLRRTRGMAAGKEVDGVTVDIEDDGPGIPREKLCLLFNKFTQVGRTEGGGYKGTGLGLAICREILRMHGVEIGVDSELGKGARFRFFLPEWR
ncbi:MAG TPA: ATP-binding protein [Elusimicrobiota bacterium]|nr:ATP-binding protein [Elusimicrobiota bacterium]